MVYLDRTDWVVLKALVRDMLRDLDEYKHSTTLYKRLFEGVLDREQNKRQATPEAQEITEFIRRMNEHT